MAQVIVVQSGQSQPVPWSHDICDCCVSIYYYCAPLINIIFTQSSPCPCPFPPPPPPFPHISKILEPVSLHYFVQLVLPERLHRQQVVTTASHVVSCE